MFAELIGGPYSGRRVQLRVVNDRIRIQDREGPALYRRDPEDYARRVYDERGELVIPYHHEPEGERQ